MSRILRIRIKGFKSFRDSEVDIMGLNVIIGINGAGKSNLLSVFELVRKVRMGQLRKYVGSVGGADRLLFMSSSVTRETYVEIVYEDFVYLLVLSYSNTNSLVISKETIRVGKRVHVLTTPGSSESGVWGNQIDTANHNWMVPSVRRALKEQMRFFIYHFSNVDPTSPLGKQSSTHDNQTLYSDGSNLASILHRIQLKDPRTFQRIEHIIRLAAPYFKELGLRRDPLNERMILLEWRHASSDHIFEFVDLSDGTKRLLGLLAAIYQDDPPDLILIDEPELGLHPMAISLLTDALSSRIDLSQFIVTTQSTGFLNRFHESDVIVVDYEKDHSKLARLDSDILKDWLEEYTIGELWEKNVIGGRP